MPAMRMGALGKVDALAGLDQRGVRDVRVGGDDIAKPDTMVAGDTGKRFTTAHDVKPT